MKELVGTRRRCGREIYCLDGFLNGVHIEGKILCFDCFEDSEKKNTAGQ